MVTSDGNYRQHRHIEAILIAVPSRNCKQLALCLYTCNWLSEYIPHYSELLATLIYISYQKAVRMDFENTERLRDLNRGLLQPRSAQPTGSSVAVYLLDWRQCHRHGCRPNAGHIITYASAEFSLIEPCYNGNEHKYLAIVWAIKGYRPQLEDQPFILMTDSKTLTCLNGIKNTRNELQHWNSYLKAHSFKIKHCPGKGNQLSDAPSHHPDPNAPSPGQSDRERIVPPKRTTHHYGHIQRTYP